MKAFLLALLLPSLAVAQCNCPCPSPSPTVSPTPAPAAECMRVVRTGYLYKPESQDTHDNREGKPMVLFTEAKRDGASLKVLDVNGKQICKFGRFAVDRYYSGAPNGCSLGPQQLYAKAMASAGSQVVYVRLSETDGLKRCIRIKDPTQRQDNR